MHLAANTITIQPSVLVTIAGAGGMANIYTTNANYSGFGGTNPSNGTFGGNGANNPQPLANAPLFNDPPATPTTTTGTASTTVKSPTLSTTSGTASTKVKSPSLSNTNVTSSAKVAGSDVKTTNKAATGSVMNVSSSDQLLSLLDGAVPGPGGKITISGSKSTSNSGNSNRVNAPGRLNANHGAVDIRRLRDRSAIDSRSRGGRLL